MLPRILLFILLPSLLPADPALRSSPALKLTFDTRQGALHQLQVRRDQEWKDIGAAIQGISVQDTVATVLAETAQGYVDVSDGAWTWDGILPVSADLATALGVDTDYPCVDADCSDQYAGATLQLFRYHDGTNIVHFLCWWNRIGS